MDKQDMVTNVLLALRNQQNWGEFSSRLFSDEEARVYTEESVIFL
jgi:hypothetical protein